MISVTKSTAAAVVTAPAAISTRVPFHCSMVKRVAKRSAGVHGYWNTTIASISAAKIAATTNRRRKYCPVVRVVMFA